MMWLVFGIICGSTAGYIGDTIEGRPVLNSMSQYHRSYKFWWFVLGNIFIYAPPSIGGYVVVGKMMNEFGVCFRVK